jgi:ATP-binding protein involved in chromosome partitioning
MYGTKGGVGKSTIAVNTAYALSASGASVGLVDLDLAGPNVSNLVGGLDGTPPTMAGFRVQPGSYGGVGVSSLGFFVAPEEAGLLTGKYLEGALEQILFHSAWDAYRYVIVDLPPGFGELHRQILTRLPARVVLITTPHVLSTQDLARGRRLIEQIGVEICGVVENMSHIACEHCGRSSRLFVSADRDGLDGLPLLARVPFSPEPRRADGRSVPLLLVDDPALDDFRSSIFSIAQRLLREG